MDIDLHCHAKFSKRTTFNIKYFIKLQQAALRNGLQAIALTEHFNTSRFNEIYETLDSHFLYRDDYYDIEGLKVFCGMEVNIREGGHVLLIGKRADVLSLHKELAPFMTKEKYPSLDYLLKEARKREMLKIGAHPFRNSNSVGRLSGDLLKQFDFLELNGKDYKKGNLVFQLANSLNMPVVAGSDAHHWLQVGCVRNHLVEDCTTVSQIRNCVKEGHYKTIISPWISLRLTSAGIVKRILKKLSYA